MDIIWPYGEKLVQLEPQPTFPAEDTSSNNAELIGHLLSESPGIIGQSKFLQGHMRTMHHIATSSMRYGGVRMQTNLETYRGFTLGFSTVEFVVMMLQDRALDMVNAAKQFEKLYPSNPFSEEVTTPQDEWLKAALETLSTTVLGEAYVFDDDPEADPATQRAAETFTEIVDADRQSGWAERYKTWPDRLPNTFNLMMKVAGDHTDSLRFSAAALLGAQTATELHDSSIAA